MKRKLIFLNISITWAILFLFSCNSSSKQNSNGSNIPEDLLSGSAKQDNYTFEDLVLFSKNKYGLLRNDGSINEFYGDFDFVSIEKNLFDFNVGCGRSGDIISVIIKPNNSQSSCFDLYIPEGNRYYGDWADSSIKVGEFKVMSENEIRGNIKLCLEKDSGCCGGESENFILKIVSPTTKPPSNK